MSHDPSTNVLLALKAIYEGNLVEFESKTGLRYFQIYIRYDLHVDGAEMCARFSSAVYQWVEWIRGSFLPHLGFDNKITLGPDISLHKGDKRAISRTRAHWSLKSLQCSVTSDIKFFLRIFTWAPFASTRVKYSG